jgi:hypothetical protein
LPEYGNAEKIIAEYVQTLRDIAGQNADRVKEGSLVTQAA